jgi:UPF0755 protein
MVSRKGKSRRKKKSSGAAGFLLGILLVATLAAGAAAWLVFVPYGPQTEIFVDLAPGSSTPSIGRQLEAAGVVRSQFGFDLLRFVRRGRLRAGEYRFDHPASVTEVYDRIARGDVYTIALIVPEGASVFEIAARAQQAGFCTRQEFLEAAVEQVGLIDDLDPSAKSLEGYLFPDTYRFGRTIGADGIIAAMVRRFRTAAAQLGLDENVHQTVILASLIERETAVNAERPLVASVFENRLAKNMPLMADSTIIYGLQLENRWRGAIYQSDLAHDTAYNTYLHSGLPPGPIANPGIPSLRAAMHPARTDYLYFVAAGNNPQGRSLFSSTLDQHTHNVAGYRRVLKMEGER